MPENRHLRFVLILFYIALGAAGACLFFGYLFKWLLPFLIALITAAALQRPTAFLTGRLRFTRSFAALLLVLLVYGLTGVILALLVSLAMSSMQTLLARLPVLLPAILDALQGLRAKCIALLQHLPAAVSGPLLHLAESAFSGLSTPSIQPEAMLETMRSAAISVPAVVVFLVTLTISTYYFTRDFPRIRAFLAIQLPPRAAEGLRRLTAYLRQTLKRWFRAAGILMLLTFLELTAGFFLLGVPRPVSTAAQVTLIDALPIFGTGTILIPWALYLLLMGERFRALTMGLLYGVVTLVRNIMEPRILGRHIGLDPLLLLICFYLGYRLLGPIGIIVFPAALICLEKLQSWGYIRLWREPETTTARTDAETGKKTE